MPILSILNINLNDKCSECESYVKNKSKGTYIDEKYYCNKCFKCFNCESRKSVCKGCGVFCLFCDKRYNDKVGKWIIAAYYCRMCIGDLKDAQCFKCGCQYFGCPRLVLCHQIRCPFCFMFFCDGSSRSDIKSHWDQHDKVHCRNRKLSLLVESSEPKLVLKKNVYGYEAISVLNGKRRSYSKYIYIHNDIEGSWKDYTSHLDLKTLITMIKRGTCRRFRKTNQHSYTEISEHLFYRIVMLIMTPFLCVNRIFKNATQRNQINFLLFNDIWHDCIMKLEEVQKCRLINNHHLRNLPGSRVLKYSGKTRWLNLSKYIC